MQQDDEKAAIGHNSAEVQFKRRVEVISRKLDEIAELQDEVKDLKKELKDDGYDAKAVNKVIKELRSGHDYMCAQLELELVLDTYRKAVGLPVTLEAAQEAAHRAAGEL